MYFNWSFILDLSVISTALLLATFLRWRFVFFQKYLIPNSLTAGFFLLLFYNFFGPKLGFNNVGLGNLAFHLLNVSFLAMTLRPSKKIKRGHSVFAMATSILFQYSLQCFAGMLITMIFIMTFWPDLFYSFGMFLTLGFSLGPGQAFAVGTGWEKYGVEGLGSIGLTFGAIGFIWASFGGIYLVNMGIKKGWLKESEIRNLHGEKYRRGIYSRSEQDVNVEKETTNPVAIDKLAYHMAAVFFVYLLSYLLLSGLTLLLGFAGPLGAELAGNLWNIFFIFAALTGLAVKSVMQSLKIDMTLDRSMLTNISGFSVDYMVAASIGAISLAVVAQYWMPILLMTMMGGLITTFTHFWLSSRIFTDYVFHRTIMIYGCATGTLTTGLALLRIVDPHFDSPVSTDFMLASGIVFMGAIPLILTMNIPARAYATGSVYFAWGTTAFYLVYLIIMFLAYLKLAGKKRFKAPGVLWVEAS